MTIPVGRLAPGDQWDQNLLDRLFANELHHTGIDFRRVDGYPNTDGCVLIVPGRYWTPERVNEALGRYRWLLLIRTGDEEDRFDVSRINHPNIRLWVQTPRTDRQYPEARLFGVGYPPHFNGIPVGAQRKPLDVFLSAQDTHQRRHECFEALKLLPDAVSRDVTATQGFTQGIDPGEYARQMVSAKVAPCPAGPASPDSFRVFEALEAHCVPIADDITPGYDSAGYWRMLFPDAPFPVLRDYESLPGYITEALAQWPANANRITAWWMRRKRQMARWLVEDLEALGAL